MTGIDISPGFIAAAQEAEAAAPRATDEAARQCPKVADTRLVPYFLHLRCRRP